MRETVASTTHRLEIVRVRRGARVDLGPDDRVVLYMRSEDDLSLGGEWHTFAILRAPANPTSPAARP